VYYLKKTDLISPTDSASYLEYYFALIGYKVSVIRTKLDNSGAELADSATAYAGFKYAITFKSHRGTVEYRAIPTIVESTLSGGTVVTTIDRTQEPLDPISGTFSITMNVGGVDNLFLNDSD
jgi:HJR/Mrr/RecB family endonuclease